MVTSNDTVKMSRAGDQFHYAWAARQALRLLNSSDGLTAITIEGPSAKETSAANEGSESIDVAEYYGSSEPSAADRIVYRQMKYSTTKADKNLGLAELGSTLTKFAMWHKATGFRPHASFSLVSNRPVGPRLKRMIKKFAEHGEVNTTASEQKALDHIGLKGSRLKAFCASLTFEDEQLSLVALRSALSAESAALSAGDDPAIGAALVDLVMIRATPANNTPITLKSVAVAFGVTPESLTPAPLQFPLAPPSVRRKSFETIAQQILDGLPHLLLKAPGGFGKTAFTAALPDLLGASAEVVVYDCFGAGTYRDPATTRHRHRDGLVQIITELAGRGLCQPLVPRDGAERHEYLRHFVSRLVDAGRRLEGTRPGCRLVIAIDAADNAQMEADHSAESPSFVRDLLLVAVPPNVTIVVSTRTERAHLLDPPPGCQTADLEPFTPDETAKLLRESFPAATDEQAVEFHGHTWGNPRVQLDLLDGSSDIGSVLSSLALLPTSSPNDALAAIMKQRVDRLLSSSFGRERELMQLLCECLGTLRPRIPLDVLALILERPAEFVVSFASDAGRGLVIDDRHIEFRDEPTETFFRTTYRSDPARARLLLERVEPLAETNHYLATTLPQLLWEAGLHEQLSSLALSHSELPKFSDVERRHLEQLRVEFALRVALQRSDLVDTAKLAFRAGQMAVSDERRMTLISENPDLAGEILDDELVFDLIAARRLPSSWPGSSGPREAVMLAVKPERAARALLRAQASSTWLFEWARHDRERYHEEVTAADMAELAFAFATLGDVERAAKLLSAWKAPLAVAESTTTVVARLLDSGLGPVVTSLSLGTEHAHIHLTAAAEMSRRGLRIPSEVLATFVRSADIAPVTTSDWRVSQDKIEDNLRGGVAWICANAVRDGLITESTACEILQRWLPSEPPRGLGDRHHFNHVGLLRAYALSALLSAVPLELASLAHPDLRPKLSEESYSEDEIAKFRWNLSPLLPWLEAWARWAIGKHTDQQTSELLESGLFNKKSSYRDPATARNNAAPILALLASTAGDGDILDKMIKRLPALVTTLWVPAIAEVFSILGRTSQYASAVVEVANTFCTSLINSRDPSDSISASLTDIARALKIASPTDAIEIFREAIGVADRAGYNVGEQWQSVIALAFSAGRDPEPQVVLARRVAAVAESIEPLVEGEFDAARSVTAIASLAGPAALGLVSTWRDQRFSRFGRLVDGLVDPSSGLFAQKPQLAAALLPFTSNAGIEEVLEIAPSATDDALGAQLWRLDRLVGNDPLRVSRLRKFGSADPEFDAPEQNGVSHASGEREYEKTQGGAARADLLDHLRSIDWDAPNVVETVESVLSDSSLFGTIGTLVEVLLSHPSNQWPRNVELLNKLTGMSRYERVRTLESLLNAPTSSRAYRRSLKTFACRATFESATDILTSNYTGFPLAETAAVLGTVPAELIGELMKSFDLTDVLGNGTRCLGLVARLAAFLSASDATEVLGFAIQSLDEAFDPSGPGSPVSSETVSAAGLPRSLAHFIWAALGDTDPSMRWRAAHALRTVFALGSFEVIDQLASALDAVEETSYRDVSLPFYRLSATVWMLLAAEREVQDHPQSISRLLPLFTALARRYQDHSLIRGSLYRIASSLSAEAGAGTPESLLVSLTQPRSLKAVDNQLYMHKNSKHSKFEWLETEFDFDFDFPEHWVQPLADAFDADVDELLKEISDVITHEWGLSLGRRRAGQVAQDPRYERDLYPESSTSFYKSSFPQVDDYKFYLSFHGLMTVAGRLDARASSLRDDESTRTQFEEWMERFGLVRDDGRWLSDLRGPIPPLLGHSTITREDSWQWDIRADQFLPLVVLGDTWVAVWLDASNRQSIGRETIKTRSALVQREPSLALVQALQTTESAWNYYLPYAAASEDEEKYSEEPYRLLGWIDVRNSREGLDEKDPFAHGLGHAPPEIAPFALSDIDPVLGAAADGDQVVVLESWASLDQTPQQRGMHGERLRITIDALDAILDQQAMDLIVSVSIERTPESEKANYSFTERVSRDYTRVLKYSPSTGWTDYRGHLVGGPKTSGSARSN